MKLPPPSAFFNNSRCFLMKKGGGIGIKERNHSNFPIHKYNNSRVKWAVLMVSLCLMDVHSPVFSQILQGRKGIRPDVSEDEKGWR